MADIAYDRRARNLDDLRRLLQQLTGHGVRIEFLKEGLTFTGDNSPMANLLLSAMGAFAEFERPLIRERQREGIAARCLPWPQEGSEQRPDRRAAASRQRSRTEGRLGPRVWDQLGNPVPILECRKLSREAAEQRATLKKALERRSNNLL